MSKHIILIKDWMNGYESMALQGHRRSGFVCAPGYLTFIMFIGTQITSRPTCILYIELVQCFIIVAMDRCPWTSISSYSVLWHDHTFTRVNKETLGRFQIVVLCYMYMYIRMSKWEVGGTDVLVSLNNYCFRKKVMLYCNICIKCYVQHTDLKINMEYW